MVTSGTLTAGQWNYVPLPAPIQLSIGNVGGVGAAIYEVATGFTGSFPDTNSQFGPGDPYAAGITNGPLFGYSDQGASAPCPASAGSFQGAFGVSGTDPSVTLPNQGSSSSNFWIDLQVSDTAPAGYTGSYRLWPNFPTVFPTQPTIDTQSQTMGTQFTLSQPCALNNVWFYSPPFAAASAGQHPDLERHNSDPGQRHQSDRILVGRRGQRLGAQLLQLQRASSFPAGNYIATVFYGGGKVFYLESRGYFGSYLGIAGPATNGISNGPLSSPSNANAFNPPGGNSCYFRAVPAPRIPIRGTARMAARTAGSTSRSPRHRERHPRLRHRRRPLTPLPSWCSSPETGGRGARPASGRARDGEAVDPQQFLDAALRVEPLLVGLAGLIAVCRYCSGFRSMSAIASPRAAGSPGLNSTPSTPGVMSSVNDPCAAATGGTPAAMASTATSPNVSSQADGSTTARAARDQVSALGALTVPVIATDGRAEAQAATSPESGPPPTIRRLRPGSADVSR